jgi:hypothetical protein
MPIPNRVHNITCKAGAYAMAKALAIGSAVRHHRQHCVARRDRHHARPDPAPLSATATAAREGHSGAPRRQLSTDRRGTYLAAMPPASSPVGAARQRWRDVSGIPASAGCLLCQSVAD